MPHKADKDFLELARIVRRIQGRLAASGVKLQFQMAFGPTHDEIASKVLLNSLYGKFAPPKPIKAKRLYIKRSKYWKGKGNAKTNRHGATG